MSTDLEILRNFGALAEELKNKHTSAEYWEKEEKWLAKRIERNEQHLKSIQMSFEKFKERFTI